MTDERFSGFGSNEEYKSLDDDPRYTAIVEKLKKVAKKH